jgi:2-polyprenyl-3-methyl-5-hydroxy-6-metoxy-1,4-benzoquinol methylase
MSHQHLRQTIYNRYGHDFQDATEVFDAAAAARWGKAYRWYLRGWLPERKDASIVEFACGRGQLLQFFKQHGYSNLQGVDISPDQVALARQVVPNVAQANVLDWLAAREQQFDLMVALDLIEHFTRDEVLQFLDLCFAALKPGGRLILQTPNADSPFGLQHRYNDITHEWAFNDNQLARLLRRAGFLDMESREQGPVPWGYSLTSTSRWILWRVIRAGLQLWNLAETGARLPVLTRVFMISGVRN